MSWGSRARPLSALLLALLLSGCPARGGRQAQPAAPPAAASGLPAAAPPTGPYAGQAAPMLAGRLADGSGPFDLSALEGKVVFLNFFATWCGPCRAEMPVMEELHRELGDRVAIVAVGADPGESPEQLAAFAEGLGLTFPVVHSEALVAADFRLIGIPTSLFIDRTGVVRARTDWMLDREGMLQGLEAANAG